jgi:hypothetical protein
VQPSYLIGPKSLHLDTSPPDGFSSDAGHYHLAAAYLRLPNTRNGIVEIAAPIMRNPKDILIEPG